MSVILQGWGSPFRPLTLGYGAAAPALSPSVLLRETFTVPLPDGAEAQRTAHGAGSRMPYLGSLEQGIAFALDFGGWLGAAETLTSASASARAEPLVTGRGAAADATSSVVQATSVAGSLVVVTLQHAIAHTVYVLTLSALTTVNRTLECRMPPIYCPD